MSGAIKSHGTLVARKPSGATGFVTIGDLGGDIVLPPVTRPTTEVTPHNDTIDSYVTGVMRRGEATFPINFVSAHSTHDEATGILNSLASGFFEGWRFTLTDGAVWVFSGFVTNFALTAPVREGAISADVTIRPSGLHEIDGTVVGSLGS